MCNLRKLEGFISARFHSERYTPLISESKGMYEVILGARMLGDGLFNLAKDYLLDFESEDESGNSPHVWATFGKDLMLVGAGRIITVPAAILNNMGRYYARNL